MAQMPEPPVTPKVIAEFLDTTVEALSQKRYLGTGPKYVKLGKRVYYRWSDVLAWIDENTISRPDDPRPAA